MTGNNTPEVQNAPLKKRQNSQYEIPLPEDLTDFHDFPTTVSYSVEPKWAEAGRDTNLVYVVMGGDRENSISRYSPQVGNKKVLRFPKVLARERGLDEDEIQAQLFSPEKGILQIVVPKAFERINKFEPQEEVVSREKIPTKKSGQNREHDQYRIFLPTRYREIYRGLPPVNRWSIGIAGDQPALIAEFVDEATADSTFGLTSRWQTKESGEEGYSTEQIAIYPPKNLIEALGWDDRPVGLVPEKDRLIFVPDPQGTSVGLGA